MMWTKELACFEAYLRGAGRSKDTVRLRTYWIRRLATDLATPDPWSVTMDDLMGWLGGTDWKPETRKSARASVQAFYGWSIDTGRLAERRNPARRLPPVGVPQATARPAPSTVLTAALWYATDRERLFLLLAALAGLRRAEIAAVHPDDIDRERGVLHVHGKGGRERNVPLHPLLLTELEAELERRAEGRYGSGYRYQRFVTPDGYLFPGVNGHVGAEVPGKAISRLLGPRWTAHTLRHRFASQAYAVERDLRAVQELLGHSKPETTARYVATPDGALRAAVAGVTAA
jgi:integrase/recombinase XerC